MAFSILAVRDGESSDDPLYPFPGEQPNSVELSEPDGEPFAPLQAVELSIGEIQGGNPPKNVLRIRKVKAAVLVTEDRVAIACSKYEKGGGFTPWSIGALPVALAANTVSKVRAARRRRGKMLVGHVPYANLVGVGFRPPSGLKGREQLRLTMTDPTVKGQRLLVLDLTLSSGKLAVDMATEIVKLAATRQLDLYGDRLEPEHRKLLKQLQDAMPLAPEPKRFSVYMLGRDAAVPTGSVSA